ncbi:MAG TPA: serine/threonine-protein kinase [Polyangia bacterium]|nr:serine/threonine-protein kinase [Polyangia bacterium]
MPSPTRFGKYDLLALLATGGMAEIWLARVSGMAGFEKLVVIKRLLDELAVDHEYVEMFLDEARINARLTHSNIVQVLELGQVDGKYFMAMEFVPGLSISQVGKRATKLLGDVPQEVACGVVAQACSGLHYAHEKTLPDGKPLNIIHRDVSPQNLILTYEGLVKVLDFGIAKADQRQSQTRTGLVKGKFSYMSPEQCLGQGLDRRSDVFALGIVLFELCTARRLFKRGSTYETYTAITNADVPPPRRLNAKIPEPVEAVIVRALAKKPDDRYATADAMQDALEEAMQKSGLRGAPTDLARFMTETFKSEQAEQQRLLSQAQRGELGSGSAEAAQVSPVAAAAAAQAESNYAVDNERTSIDPLPQLGDESGRNWKAEADVVGGPVGGPVVIDPPEFDSQEDIKTRAIPPPMPPEPASSTASTSPTGVPSLRGSQIPPLYYVLAVGAALLIVAIAWLIAR